MKDKYMCYNCKEKWEKFGDEPRESSKCFVTVCDKCKRESEEIINKEIMQNV